MSSLSEITLGGSGDEGSPNIEGAVATGRPTVRVGHMETIGAAVRVTTVAVGAGVDLLSILCTKASR